MTGTLCSVVVSGVDSRCVSRAGRRLLLNRWPV